MKKLTLLTSILALAACGGGSGGGSGVNAPRAVVTPDNPLLVDSDSGLGMIDTNKVLSANVAKAGEITQSIENENTNDIARSAMKPRMAKSNISNISQEDISKAYETMYNIFVKHEYEGYTNHDVLFALALIYMDKTKILELLGHEDNKLDEKIDALKDGLHENDDFAKDAQSIYDDFGSDFDLTLKDAKFYHNSNDADYYTFEFDGDNLVALKEKNGGTYTKEKNGAFIAQQRKGYEYVFAFKKDGNNSFSGKVEKFYENEPTPEQLKEDLLAEVRLKNDLDEATCGEVAEILNTATVYSMKEIKKEEVENHIVGRQADYKDIVRIETGSKSLGLKYSDFGLIFNESIFNKDDDFLFNTNLNSFVYSEHNAFVGGYEGKKANPESGATYKGDSYVGLTRKTADEDMEDLEDLQPRNNYYKGSAKLTIDNNMKQKLVADFSGAGWYEVTVDNMPVNGHGGDFSFDAKGNTIDANWQVDPDHNAGEMENSNIKYYGPTPDNATEVVGSVQYIENHNTNSDWTFKADITFGAKKQ